VISVTMSTHRKTERSLNRGRVRGEIGAFEHDRAEFRNLGRKP
jgi:general stress protein YciG